MLLHISSLLALAELNQFRRSLFNPFGMSRTFLPPGPLLTFSLLIGGPILAIGAMRIWKRCSLDVLVGRVRIKVPMLLLLVFAFCLTGQMLCAVIDGL